MEVNTFKVCVECITFNHAPYIEECMNGFTMQQTEFPYVCCIIDDASNDGSPDVIRKYMQTNFNLEDNSVVRIEETNDFLLWFAQHNTNKNCYFAVYFLKYNHYKIKKNKRLYIEEWHNNIEYTALCEGDDYWVAPEKLKRQVDFMECHPDHSLCFCAHRELYPSGKTKDVMRYKEGKEICPMEDIILRGGGYMATNSMFYRNSMYVHYTTWAPGCPVGDRPKILTLAHKGKVGYMAEIMCVYRMAALGSWSVRMFSSKKMRKIHYQGIIKMWHQFDEWSDKRYHQLVMKRIRKIKIIHIKSEMAFIIRSIFKINVIS